MQTSLTTGTAGKALIEEFEALRLEAYPDPQYGWKLPTIGYGHTLGVRQGDVITEDQAELFLQQDLRASEDLLNHWVTPQLNQNQFDACVSILFNVGPGLPCSYDGTGGRDGIIWLRLRDGSGNLVHSSLLYKLNASNYAGAAAEFLKWCQPISLPGILRRRQAEAALFSAIGS